MKGLSLLMQYRAYGQASLLDLILERLLQIHSDNSDAYKLA